PAGRPGVRRVGGPAPLVLAGAGAAAARADAARTVARATACARARGRVVRPPSGRCAPVSAPPGDGVPVRTRPGRRTVGVPAWGAGAGAVRPTGPGPVLTRPAEDG